MSIFLPPRFNAAYPLPGYIYEKTSPTIGASWAGLDIRDNGTRIYLTSAARNTAQRDLSTPWDIATIGSQTTNFTIARTDSPSCRIRDDDGSQFWYLKDDAGVVRIYKWELPTAYTIVGADATGANSTDLLASIITTTQAKGLSIHPNGNRGWTLDPVNASYAHLVEFTMGSSWSASALGCPSPDCIRKQVDYTATQYWDMVFSDDGRLVFFSSASYLSYYLLPAPWDINGMSSTPTYELDITAQSSESGVPSGIRGITVSPDLNKVYILSITSREIYQYKKIGT